MFGVPRFEAYSKDTNENWYIIEQKSELADFFDNNPSKLYSFYYVRNNTLENGYFIKGSVWIFEIRYEFDTDSDQYKFKMFIESADSTRNGIYTNYYKMNWAIELSLWQRILCGRGSNATLSQKVVNPQGQIDNA